MQIRDDNQVADESNDGLTLDRQIVGATELRVGQSIASVFVILNAWQEILETNLLIRIHVYLKNVLTSNLGVIKVPILKAR